jgi:hypothetical protein
MIRDNEVVDNEKQMYILIILGLSIALVGIVLFNMLGDNPLGLLTGSAIVDYAILEEHKTLLQDFDYVTPYNITPETALNSLMAAENEIKSMESMGISFLFVNDTLLFAKRAYIGHNLSAFYENINKTKDKKQKDYLKSLIPIALNTPSYEV